MADGYASNPALMAALLEIPKRKRGLVGAPIAILANYRRDLSGKAAWKVRGTRFLVVTVTKGDPRARARSLKLRTARSLFCDQRLCVLNPTP